MDTCWIFSQQVAEELVFPSMTWSSQNSVLTCSAITTATLGHGNTLYQAWCPSQNGCWSILSFISVFIMCIHIIYCPMGSSNNDEKWFLSTLCSLLPPKALGYSGKAPGIPRSVPAGMAALALAQSPQPSSNLKDSFILAICSPYGSSSAFQAKVLHLSWKLIIAATASIIYFISEMI